MARLSALVRRDLAVDPEITGVTADSRRVRPGFLFAALPGTSLDGRRFVSAALEAGASAILAGEDMPALSATVVRAADPRRAYALAAAALCARQPRVIVAVTGTNGKTSVATFCRQIFASLGHASASMGTLGVVAGETQLTPPGLTTPDAGDLAVLLADLSDRGVTHLAMEASSHGVDQRRLDGVRLTAAGFLNLTQDHLDYHGTMEAYRAAKLRLFHTLLPRGGTAVLNADSESFPAFAATVRSHGRTLMTVGAMGQGLNLVSRRAAPGGQRLRINAWGREQQIILPLAGAFQAANALVAAGLCIAAGGSAENVLAALERLHGAPGRLQKVGEGPRGGTAYVDYAHTPDGLRTVLTALRPHVSGRLFVVFGAGGDRDRGKRPQMGAIAADLADVAIVTDDNPRSEAPTSIRREIMAGNKDLEEIGGRAEAIAVAVSRMRRGDILVVAGKGHERGQDIAGVVQPFDDVAVTAAALLGGASV